MLASDVDNGNAGSENKRANNGAVDDDGNLDKTAPPRLDKLWHSMPYLDALLKEVMRHHPPANSSNWGIDGEDLQLTCEVGKVGHDGRATSFQRTPAAWLTSSGFTRIRVTGRMQMYLIRPVS